MKTNRRQLMQGLGLAAPALIATRLPQEAAPEDGAPKLLATLILVRHTEKAKDDRVDPSLSEEGVARASEFASMFASAGVTGLIHSGYKRTRDTLAPLANELKLESEAIGAMEMPRLMERLGGAGPDEVIAVAGHSNTIPAIAHAFGVLLPDLAPKDKGSKLAYGYLPHGAYDRIHVLTPGTKSARLLELRYGEPC